jgi:hypothetical protein
MEALLAIGAVDETGSRGRGHCEGRPQQVEVGSGRCPPRPRHAAGLPDDLRESAEELAALVRRSSSRSLLLLGERHGDHEASRAALRIFERLGAEPWAAQARRIAARLRRPARRLRRG